MARIALSMTTSEVIRIAGRPNSIETNSTSRWIYEWMQLSPGVLTTEGIRADCYLVISNGIVVGKEINDHGRWIAVE